MARPCALYRHYDKKGRLLYVGISVHPMRRQWEHEINADWYYSVTNITVQWFRSKRAAQKAEREAIVEEDPQHNSSLGTVVLSDLDKTMIGFVYYSKAFTKLAVMEVAETVCGPSIKYHNIQAAMGKRGDGSSPYIQLVKEFDDFLPDYFVRGVLAEDIYVRASELMGQEFSQDTLRKRYGKR